MKITKMIIAATLLISSNVAFSQTEKQNKMNLKELHTEQKGVQTNMMFPAKDGKVISLQILKGSELAEHVTQVPALLVCVSGTAVYGEETGKKVTLLPGDFVNIEPKVKHWVFGVEDSNLLLIK